LDFSWENESPGAIPTSNVLSAMICQWLKDARAEQPTPQNIIGVGQFAIFHKLNNKIVRKVPSDKSYIYSVQAIEIEAKIYGHPGRHKRIAKCIRCGDEFAL
jgi:hypothetical protein